MRERTMKWAFGWRYYKYIPRADTEQQQKPLIDFQRKHSELCCYELIDFHMSIVCQCHIMVAFNYEFVLWLSYYLFEFVDIGFSCRYAFGHKNNLAFHYHMQDQFKKFILLNYDCD